MLKGFQSNYGQPPRKKQKFEKIEKGNTEKVLDALATVCHFDDKCGAVSIDPNNPKRLIVSTNGSPKKETKLILKYFKTIKELLEKDPNRTKELRAAIALKLTEAGMNSEHMKSASSHHVSSENKNKIISMLLEQKENDKEIKITMDNKSTFNSQCRENTLIFLSSAIHYTNALKRIEENILNTAVSFDFLDDIVIEAEEENIHAEIRQVMHLVEMDFFTDKKYEEINSYIGISKTCCLDCHLFLMAVKEVAEKNQKRENGSIWFSSEKSHFISFDGWTLPSFCSESYHQEKFNEEELLKENRKEKSKLSNLDGYIKLYYDVFIKKISHEEAQIKAKKIKIESFSLDVLKKYYNLKKKYFINHISYEDKESVEVKINNNEKSYLADTDGDFNVLNEKIEKLNKLMKTYKRKINREPEKDSQTSTLDIGEKSTVIDEDFDDLEKAFLSNASQQKRAAQMTLDSEDEVLQTRKKGLSSLATLLEGRLKKKNEAEKENEKPKNQLKFCSKADLSQKTEQDLKKLSPLDEPNTQISPNPIGNLRRVKLENATLKNMGLFENSNSVKKKIIKSNISGNIPRMLV